MRTTLDQLCHHNVQFPPQNLVSLTAFNTYILYVVKAQRGTFACVLQGLCAERLIVTMEETVGSMRQDY